MDDSNSHSKPMGSNVVLDLDASCECVFMCTCISKNDAQIMPDANDSCRSKNKINTTNKIEPRKRSSDNGNFAKTKNKSNSQARKTISSDDLTDSDMWGSYETNQETNNPPEKYSVSSDFDTRLLVFCLKKPKRRQIDAREQIYAHKKNKKLQKHKCKEINADNINMECYDKIIEMYLKLLTAHKLNEHDFLHFKDTMIFLSTKGVVPDELLIKLEKTIRENGYISAENVISNTPGMNAESNHQTQVSLKYYNSAGNKYFVKEHWGLVDKMKSLQEKKKIPDAIFASFMEPIERADIIQSILKLLNCLYYPAILTNFETLREMGLLNKVYLSKFMELDDLEDKLLKEKAKLRKDMKDSPRKMQNCFCPSAHNTPLCDMCGLQSSWLKTFKKRGILINQADKCNNRHIWHNNSGSK